MYEAGDSPITWTGDCVEDAYTEDLNGGTVGIGNNENDPDDSDRFCSIPGRTLIEDIEEEP